MCIRALHGAVPKNLPYRTRSVHCVSLCAGRVCTSSTRCRTRRRTDVLWGRRSWLAVAPGAGSHVSEQCKSLEWSVTQCKSLEWSVTQCKSPEWSVTQCKPLEWSVSLWSSKSASFTFFVVVVFVRLLMFWSTKYNTNLNYGFNSNHKTCVQQKKLKDKNSKNASKPDIITHTLRPMYTYARHACICACTCAHTFP